MIMPEKIIFVALLGVTKLYSDRKHFFIQFEKKNRFGTLWMSKVINVEDFYGIPISRRGLKKKVSPETNLPTQDPSWNNNT